MSKLGGVPRRRRKSIMKHVGDWVRADLKATPNTRTMVLALLLGIIVTIMVMGIGKYLGWL